MKKLILVTLVSLGFALNACGGSSSGSNGTSAPLGLFQGTPTTPVMVGPEGGSILSDDGLARLVIPAGALGAMTEIEFKSSTPPEGVGISGTDSLLIYEASPNGLTFTQPATMEVDARSFKVSDTEYQIPVILSATNSDVPATVAANQSLDVDFGTGVAIHRGSISSFSIKTVGRSEYSARIEGVPEFHPENSAFGPVEVTFIGSSPIGLDSNFSSNSYVQAISFLDRSILPVFVGRSDIPFDFFAETSASVELSGGNTTITRSLNVPYSCGPANTGEFIASLNVQGTTFVTTRSTTTEYTFGLSPFFGVIAEEEITRSSTTQTPFMFGFTGRRSVECRGASEIEEEPMEETSVGGGGETTEGGSGEETVVEEPVVEEVALFSGTYGGGNSSCQIGSTLVSTSGNTVSFTPLGSENSGTSTCSIGADPGECTSDSNSLTFFGVSDHTCSARALNGGAEINVSCVGSQGSCSETLLRE